MDILRVSSMIGSRWRQERLAEALSASVRVTSVLPIVASLVWALTLSAAGGLMVLAASGAAPWLAPPLLFGGLTLGIAGLFVFQVAVANKAFPRANPRVIRNAEAVSGVALLIGLIVTILTLLP